MLDRHVGSCGDVDAIGTYQDGKWIVVMCRLLDTGHEDDVLLIPCKMMPLGVSIGDNGSDAEHTVIEDVVVLEWK